MSIRGQLLACDNLTRVRGLRPAGEDREVRVTPLLCGLGDGRVPDEDVGDSDGGLETSVLSGAWATQISLEVKD